MDCPKTILVVGSGVFGLGTAEALLRRPAFANATVTVVDRGTSMAPAADLAQHFPPGDAASIDTSRIIRADYADPAYAAFAADALAYWRGTKRRDDDDDDDFIGGAGRYTESGLVVVADAPEPEAKHAVSGPDAKKSGMDYVRQSWANVKGLAAADPYQAARLTLLPSPETIRTALSGGTNDEYGGVTGIWGYRNDASGWADAAASMSWLLRRMCRRWTPHRLGFRQGHVTDILLNIDHATDDDHNGRPHVTVTGVRLSDNTSLTADLVVLAAGAWTASLLAAVEARLPSTPPTLFTSSSSTSTPTPPATSILNTVTATGQVLGYVPLASDAEHARAAAMPIVLNLSTGLFVIPPAPTSRELKVARHSYGYLNPVPVPQADQTLHTPVTAPSTPRTHFDDPSLAIPPEGAADLRRCLRQLFPSLPALAARPFTRTRLCCGHAFKFLPVLGDHIVDCILGTPPPAFRHKWAWPLASSTSPSGVDVITEDGSRGGRPGLVLEDELRYRPLQ